MDDIPGLAGSEEAPAARLGRLGVPAEQGARMDEQVDDRRHGHGPGGAPAPAGRGAALSSSSYPGSS